MKAPSHTADAPPQERPGFGMVIASLREETARVVNGMRMNHHAFSYA